MNDRTRPILRTAAATMTAGALTLGVVIPATAHGGPYVDGTVPDGTTSDAATFQARHAARHAAHEAALAEVLADELGLDTTTVAEALDAARDQLARDHRVPNPGGSARDSRDHAHGHHRGGPRVDDAGRA
jgi:hypothetical protein